MRYRGIVQKGEGRGRALGFPTINIPVDEKEGEGGENAGGIFAATVFIDGVEYPAAAYADQARKILEAHLLDFSGDLYGREVEIELLQKIREDARFASEEELKAAIAADVAKIREYFTT